MTPRVNLVPLPLRRRALWKRRRRQWRSAAVLVLLVVLCYAVILRQFVAWEADAVGARMGETQRLAEQRAESAAIGARLLALKSQGTLLARLEATLRDLATTADAKGPCKVAVEALRKSSPAVMDPQFQAALEASAAAHAGGKSTRMPSGAGHDAQTLSTIMPSGMMFVPSIGGISHHWTENTSDEDIMRGAQVFADWAARLWA